MLSRIAFPPLKARYLLPWTLVATPLLLLRLQAVKQALPKLLLIVLWMLQTKPMSALSAWLRPAAPVSNG